MKQFLLRRTEFDSIYDTVVSALCFLEGKGGRRIGLTNLPPSYADCLEIWKPQPAGILRACNWIALFYFLLLSQGYVCVIP